MLCKLSPEHKLMALMLAIGYTPDYIQKKTGRSRQTLWNLKKDELFNSEVTKFEKEYHQQIMTTVIIARTKIEEALEAAVDVKIALMKQDKNLNVKNNAATDILEMAGIKRKIEEAKISEGHLCLVDEEDKSIPDDIPPEDMHLFLDDIVTEDDFIGSDE